MRVRRSDIGQVPDSVMLFAAYICAENAWHYLSDSVTHGLPFSLKANIHLRSSNAARGSTVYFISSGSFRSFGH